MIETREVPDDLERNVDLFKTRAGGATKDEFRMSNEEKDQLETNDEGRNPQAVKVKAEEQPQVNK